MLVFEYLIDSAGSVIYPTSIQSNTSINTLIAPSYNQITLIYYNGITTGANGNVIPNTPVITGMTGMVQLQARTTSDSIWSNITNGLLDLSTGANMAFPSGAIYQINAVCTDVTGCNYILIRFDMGG